METIPLIPKRSSKRTKKPPKDSASPTIPDISIPFETDLNKPESPKNGLTYKPTTPNGTHLVSDQDFEPISNELAASKTLKLEPSQISTKNAPGN
jgi:hypothetical protein